MFVYLLAEVLAGIEFKYLEGVHQEVPDFPIGIENPTEGDIGIDYDLHDFRNLSLFFSHQPLLNSFASSSTSS